MTDSDINRIMLAHNIHADDRIRNAVREIVEYAMADTLPARAQADSQAPVAPIEYHEIVEVCNLEGCFFPSRVTAAIAEFAKNKRVPQPTIAPSVAHRGGDGLPSADEIYSHIKGVAAARTTPENICDVLVIIKKLMESPKA